MRAEADTENLGLSSPAPALVGHKPLRYRLPERCKGPCLVYLRDGVDVISRPDRVLQPGAPDTYAGFLVSAFTMAEYEERQQAACRRGRRSTGTINLAGLAALARTDRGE